MNKNELNSEAKAANYGVLIRELGASTVYLFREQTHRGRVVVVSKCDVAEIVDLTPAECKAFMADVVTVAATLHRLFNPSRVDYGSYGDLGGRLHVHLVPRYADDDVERDGAFALDPKRTYLADDENAALVTRLSAELLLADEGGIRSALQRLRHEIADDGRIDYGESALLLEALRPLAESDRRIADLAAMIEDFRADGVVTREESERIIAQLDAIFV